MIYELRTYTLQPGTQAQYLKNSAEIGRKIRGDKYGKLEGFWYTEFGTLNQVVHLWGFESLNDRERLRGELAKNKDWTEGYLPHTRGILLAQENKILSPVLALKPPPEAGQLNEAVHLWAYKDLNDRAAVRGKVLQDPEWQAFLGKSAPCLAEMKSIILNPASHSPMQ